MTWAFITPLVLSCFILRPSAREVSFTSFLIDSSGQTGLFIDQIPIDSTYHLSFVDHYCYDAGKLDLFISRETCGFFLEVSKVSFSPSQRDKKQYHRIKLGNSELDSLRSFEAEFRAFISHKSVDAIYYTNYTEIILRLGDLEVK